MNTKTPTVEDIGITVGSRLRTALHLVNAVNDGMHTDEVFDYDLLYSAELLLEEASKILMAADPNYAKEVVNPAA